MYFADNIRMSNGKIEYKDLKRKKNLNKIIYFKDKAYFIPYSRTESIECQSALPNFNTLQTCICRRVIYNEILMGEYKMRVALEENVDASGLNYIFTAEVEYNQLIFTQYTSNKFVEDEFFQIFKDHYLCHMLNIKTKDVFKFTGNEIVDYGSRVFKSLNVYYTPASNEIKVYKLDGYKCKFANKNGVLTYYDVKHNYCQGYCNFLDEYENIVFQGEVMDNRVIFITDILGGFVNGNDVHMPQPLEVLPFFEKLTEQLKMKNIEQPFKMVLYDKCEIEFKVFTQYEVKNDTLPCKYPYDGYIIIQNANILKYKIPTIDVIVDKGYLKVTNRILPICDDIFENLEEGRIYEVQQTNDLKYKILKIRYDRTNPSTNEEFEEFLKELSFLRKGIRASNSKESLEHLKKVNNMKKSSNSQKLIKE